VPFYVAAPHSSFDRSLASGDEIVVEQRDPAEVLELGGVRISPADARALNPAFDVTPGHLVSAFVTESGVLRPPYGESIASIASAEVAPA
jgi:methylthioribose-1-phosphate isomerase